MYGIVYPLLSIGRYFTAIYRVVKTNVCVCEWKTLIGIVEYAYMCVSMYGGGGGGSGIKWQNYGVCG